jgi:large subunit ribosomal protein L13
MAIIDADGLILGRLSTHVAKRLMNGEDIVVVNAEKAIVSGSKVQLLEHYKHRRERGTRNHGPFYPRDADMILKRTVRGMLEYKKPSGRAAFRRLKVYVGVPNALRAEKAETLETAKKPHMARYTTLAAISKELGSKREVRT